jgi:hypothetical protein
MLLDPQRILPQHLRRERLVDIGMDRLRAEEGLPQTDMASVGVDLDPDDVGKLGQADRFDLGDFHRRFVSSNVARGMAALTWASSSQLSLAALPA